MIFRKIKLELTKQEKQILEEFDSIRLHSTKLLDMYGLFDEIKYRIWLVLNNNIF